MCYTARVTAAARDAEIMRKFVIARARARVRGQSLRGAGRGGVGEEGLKNEKRLKKSRDARQ